MRIILKFTLAVLVFSTAAISLSAQTEPVLESIARSHIDANIPDRQYFDEYLKRDLAAYFKKQSGKDVSVEYDLLRDGPTQTGIAYPKYYAWVIVREDEKIIDQGIVRLAAIERKRFDITHFISRSELVKTPDSAAKIFPTDVVKRIDARMGKIEKSEL